SMQLNNGSFDFAGIVPGSYVLVASQNGPRVTVLSASFPVEVRDVDRENVTFAVTKPLLIAGRITIEGHTLIDNDPMLATIRLLVRTDPLINTYSSPIDPSTGTFTV